MIEFSFKSIDKPMGIATYKFTREVPEQYKNYLPDPEELGVRFNEMWRQDERTIQPHRI
jgi:hypothetical protein